MCARAVNLPCCLLFAADIRILSAYLCQELRAVRNRLEAVENSMQNPGLVCGQLTTSSPISILPSPRTSTEKAKNRLQYHVTDLLRRQLTSPEEFYEFESEMTDNDSRRDAVATELERILDGHDVPSLVRNCFNKVVNVKLKRLMNISGRNFKCRAVPSELFNLHCAVARKRFEKATDGQVKSQIGNCLGNSHGDEQRYLSKLEKQGIPTEMQRSQSTESQQSRSTERPHHRKGQHS